MFSLNDQLVKPSGEQRDKVNVPKEHKFVMTGITSQQLSVLAQYPHQGKQCVTFVTSDRGLSDRHLNHCTKSTTMYNRNFS